MDGWRLIDASEPLLQMGTHEGIPDWKTDDDGIDGRWLIHLSVNEIVRKIIRRSSRRRLPRARFKTRLFWILFYFF